GGELAQVALGDVRLASAVQVPDVVALAVNLDLGGDITPVGLAARDGAGVFLKLGPLQRQCRMIARRLDEPDPAWFAGEDLASQEPAADAVELRHSILDLERRLDA